MFSMNISQSEKDSFKKARRAAIDRAAVRGGGIVVMESGFSDTYEKDKFGLGYLGLSHLFRVYYWDIAPRKKSVIERILNKFRIYLSTTAYLIGEYSILFGENPIETIKNDIEAAGIAEFRIYQMVHKWSHKSPYSYYENELVAKNGEQTEEVILE